MVKKRKGHVVNISSIGVLTNAPRFGAYVASKVRRSTPGRAAPPANSGPGHHLHHHQHAPGAHADDRAHQDLQQRADPSPGGAADMIAQACTAKPAHATRLGHSASCSVTLMAPRIAQIVMEHHLPHVPRQRRRQEPQARREAPRSRSCRRRHCVAADDGVVSRMVIRARWGWCWPNGLLLATADWAR